MLRRVLIGPIESPSGNREAPVFELVALAIFLVPLLLFGIYPAPILQVIDSTVRSLASLGLV
jgi:NADH:ubiquinone oxidoreductase subunit 4 (subunit M)